MPFTVHYVTRHTLCRSQVLVFIPEQLFAVRRDQPLPDAAHSGRSRAGNGQSRAAKIDE
jgi:hypothetical protein